MTTLTADQIFAIETYEEMAPKVKAFGLFNFDREDRILFKKGRKLKEATLKVTRVSNRTEYTDSEVAYLLTTYVASGADMEATRDAYFTQFPNSKHTPSSVWMKISRIRTLDNHFKDDTQWEVDQQIKSLCKAFDPDRFAV
mgnify:FL=1|tara:strand:+ start:305 stop:727 length:423 start_codon:yes stop_codon:yes gene_type:complete